MSKIKVNCSNCQLEILKTPSDIKKSKTGNLFCSRNCSATFNNKGVRRHGGLNKCKQCEKTIPSRKKYCSKECRTSHLGYLTLPTNTLKEITERLSVRGKHPSWRNAHIRNHNRHFNKDKKSKPCAKCGYSLYVELCHIKQIKDFDDTATLEQVNSPNNVIQLCRNCHWELDHDLFKIEDVLSN